MKCERIEELLSPYIENELSSKEKREVKTHLKECEHCSTLLSFMKVTTESLADLPELEVSEILLNKLYSIPSKKKKIRFTFDFLFRPSLQPVYTIASIFLILVSFYFFHPDRNFINKTIDRQIHLGYSKIEELYVNAGSLKDNLGVYTNNFLRSLKKISPWGESGD